VVVFKVREYFGSHFGVLGGDGKGLLAELIFLVNQHLYHLYILYQFILGGFDTHSLF
jgi:hypothetical protein